MFTVLRRYKVRLGTVGDAAARAEESLVPRLRAVSGFVAYHLLHTGDSTVAALALFETRPAADIGATLFTEWFRSDWPAFRQMAPDLSVAESLTLAQANGAGEAVEAVLVVSRDRRRIGERRVLVVARVPERRAALDRRAVFERRAGPERRGTVVPAETDVPPERRRIAPPWRRREAFHSR